VQRLMGGLNPTGLNPGGHGLDALAIAGQQQPSAVAAKRGEAIGVAEGCAERLDIRMEARFTAAR
jgi:hypothetical protein